MKIKYLLLDLDGCLSGGKGTHFNLPAISILKDKLASAPFPTGICTGRSAAYVEVVSQMLNIDAWCVCENGSYLFHPRTEEFLYHPNVTPEKRQTLSNLKKLLESKKDNPKDALFGANVEYGKEVCVSLNHPTMEIERLHQIVSESIDSEGLFVGCSATAVDITPKDVDKGAGVRFLADHLKLPLSSLAGIGDSSGDLPFLSIIGTSGCPANANDKIKKIVNYQAKSNENIGVNEFVDWLVLNL